MSLVCVSYHARLMYAFTVAGRNPHWRQEGGPVRSGVGWRGLYGALRTLCSLWYIEVPIAEAQLKTTFRPCGRDYSKIQVERDK